MQSISTKKISKRRRLSLSAVGASLLALSIFCAQSPAQAAAHPGWDCQYNACVKSTDSEGRRNLTETLIDSNCAMIRYFDPVNLIWINRPVLARSPQAESAVYSVYSEAAVFVDTTCYATSNISPTPRYAVHALTTPNEWFYR
jgi:hypothetical protein